MENNAPATNNFLNWVEIKNFKSIKDLRLDCKRVNVFIGKPNVGKSNILEGLGLLGGSYDDHSPILKKMIRFKTFSNLFGDDDLSSPVIVSSDKLKALVDFDFLYDRYYLIVGQIDWFDHVYKTINNYRTALSPLATEEKFSEMMSWLYPKSSQIDIEHQGYGNIKMFRFRITNNGKSASGNANGWSLDNPIKLYKFKDGAPYNKPGNLYLSPPFGDNLFTVINNDENLRKDVGELFQENSLDFVLSKKDKAFYIQKRESGYVYTYSYASIADTFQRYTFYLAAIESNKNSVIVFEEPEVHSFPPYTQDIAYRMIYSEVNQFFVSTHSPYLLQTLVSNLGDDQLNVFVTYYKDHETKVKMLTPEEIGFVQEYSTDVFFNLDRFVPNAQSANPA